MHRDPRTAPARGGSLRALAWMVPALLLAGATAARADLIETVTIQPVSLDDPGAYPTVLNIGTFTFTVPPTLEAFGGYLASATVSGQWGTSFLTPDTAAGVYTVGGATVFTCNDGDACWGNDVQTAWSYTFAPSELAALLSGSADFNAMQTDFGQVQADLTTLTLDFSVPEPASIALFATALLGLALRNRRTR